MPSLIISFPFLKSTLNEKLFLIIFRVQGPKNAERGADLPNSQLVSLSCLQIAYRRCVMLKIFNKRL